MTKSCWTCTWASVSLGAPATRQEPGEPAEAECVNALVDEELFNHNIPHGTDAYEFYAEHCGHHDPRMLKNCGNCGTLINQPEDGWPYWATYYESVPTCGEECRVALQAKFDSDARDMLKREEEWLL